MRTRCITRFLVLYLSVALCAATLPAPAWAMYIPSGPASSNPEHDMARIQSVLESTLVQQRLMDYGLTPEEATAKISTLSDQQVHELAANLDALQPGGDAVGAVITLLLIAVIVVIVLQATGHDIIVK